MKMNRKFLTVLAVLVILCAAAGCNKNKQAEGQTSAEISGAAAGKDYSGLLQGDFSVVAGTYVDGLGYKIQLKADGTFSEWIGYGKAYSFGYGEVYHGWSKAYSWILEPPPEASPIPLSLWPVGVDIIAENGVIIKTDTTKDRLAVIGYDPPTASELQVQIYHKETSGRAATSAQTVPYYATSNLRLRSEPDTSKDNRIAGVPQGSKVELLETGKTETIDNISAPWYKVKTEDGTIGWLFSGYLTVTAPTRSYDYSKILNGDLSDFAGSFESGDWSIRRLNADGTFKDGQTASGFTRQNNPKQASGGDFYMWNVHASEGGGFAVALFPIGVDVMGYEGIIPTDKTKIRLTMGQDLPSSKNDVFLSEK